MSSKKTSVANPPNHSQSLKAGCEKRNQEKKKAIKGKARE